MHYLDIGRTFLGADGKIDADLMPDLLHPNAKGYAICAKAIEPTRGRADGRNAGEALRKTATAEPANANR